VTKNDFTPAKRMTADARIICAALGGRWHGVLLVSEGIETGLSLLSALPDVSPRV